MLTPQFLLPMHHEIVVDLFAGGGGASTGIELAIGRAVDVAVNHDGEAVSLHQANHPQTRHYCSMRPTQHPTNNDVLRAPPGVPHEECQPLAITRIGYTDGALAVRSYWQPNQQEREALAAGALVCFECWGTTHPPVALSVDGVATA